MAAAKACIIDRSEAKRRHKQICEKHRHLGRKTQAFDLRRILELRRRIAIYQSKLQGKRNLKKRPRKRGSKNSTGNPDRKDFYNCLMTLQKWKL